MLSAVSNHVFLKLLSRSSFSVFPGFANFGAMGIALATLGVFAPTRKRALVKIAPRALIGGNMVALMTASIAGHLIFCRAIEEFFL